MFFSYLFLLYNMDRTGENVMKLSKLLFICLPLSGAILAGCNSGNNNNNPKKEVFEEARKESLFELGKTTGYEIKGTITENEKVTHYTAAMKRDILYLHFQEVSGGGWNYMACQLSSEGKAISRTYKNDLTPFGDSQTRDGEAFKLCFNTSVDPFYEASKPAICNNSKYVGDETILGMNACKFQYEEDLGVSTQLITSYVEETYGLTLKITTQYVKGQEVTTAKEMIITSIKKGSDVVIPSFEF